MAYSLVGLQEMNLAWRFPIIYWNCACLIVNSGALEDDEQDEDIKKKKAGKDYRKLATAIGKIRQQGVELSLVDINKSAFGFKPDASNNKIWFGLRGLARVGDDLIKEIVENRPYTSVEDFYSRVKPNKLQMLSLIKSGAFDQIQERKDVMTWYLWQICDKKSNLTISNVPALTKANLFPNDISDELKLCLRVYNFNKYIKLSKNGDGDYKADVRSQNFLAEIGQADLVAADDIVSAKEWDKVYKKYMKPLKEWITANKEELLMKLNDTAFQTLWDESAKGTYSTWEMEVMCFYYHEHELAHLNNQKYGYVNYFALPEQPAVDRTFPKGDKVIKLYKLVKICGTCIAKNKDKATVSLLTTSGVVNVKFNKEFFSMYDKRISDYGADGKKHIVERSWFDRGSMIVVNGVRIDDNFLCKKYASTPGHRLMKITSIDENGNIELQGERYHGGFQEESD